jgi:sugar phosphate isomerase/epimerase
MDQPHHPIGVPSHLFRGSPEAVAAACRGHGLTCVQLTPNFPGLGFHEPGQITPERCRRAAAPFAAAGVPVACLSAPANLLDPDLARRHRGILRLHAFLRHARDFGTPYVITETGSLSPVSPCEPYPANRSPQAWAELRLIVAEALRVAEGHGSVLLLRPERAHVLASVGDALRLGAELDRPSLGFVLDPAALLVESPPERLRADLERLAEQLGPRAPVVHVKDLRHDAHGVSLPPAGGGALDYALLLEVLDRHQPQAPLILGHLRPDEVPAAKAALDRLVQ